MLGACSGDDPEAAPSPTASPSPALPDVQPIAADVAVAERSLSSGAVIDRSQSRTADADAVAALSAAVTSWLDTHLDSLQQGDGGALADVAAAGMLDDADPTLVDGVTTSLASRDDPVRAARYDLEVGHDGAPRWLRARITVRRASGGVAEATFVFVPGEDATTPVLIALEPRGGAA